MGLFGADQSEVQWLRERVKFLEEQLTMIADQTAAARLLPRPERKDPGKPKVNWRLKVDAPEATAREAAIAGAGKAVAVEASFDSRQP